jgi:peptidoglycan/xylan/chitin deacetylase (PgdA/CDA1 family)
LLTFDDGYLDFYIHALPLLKRYGFSATVFIIAEKVGQKSERRDFMNWHHLKHLLLDGIEFGSHSATHPSLLSLSHADIVREGLRGRTVLEQKLGIPIQAFCYPFGDSNPIIRHLIGACGYELGLSLGLKGSGLNEDLLNLSRIEIEGTDSIKNFVSKLKL